MVDPVLKTMIKKLDRETDKVLLLSLEKDFVNIINGYTSHVRSDLFFVVI